MGSVSLEPLRTPLGRHAGARMASAGGLVTREAKEGGVGGGGGFRSCPKGAKKNSSEITPLSSSSILSGRTTGFKLRKRRLTEDLEPVKEEEEEDEEEVEEEEEDGMVVKKGGGGGGVRITVHVRLRPMSKAEKEAGSRSCVRVVNKREIYLTEFSIETDYLRLKRLKGRHFVFDAAFPDDSSQQEVYDASTAELVEAVVQGRNGSVFCYGATGAGKTYTMLGTVQNPGVMVLALKDLFSKLKQISKEGQYVVHLSYLEVYNETVKDLLSPGRPLILREDSKQGIVAAGLTQYQAYSADEVMALLQQGNENRTTEPTRVNETSSRSHAILQVVAEYKLRTDTGSISRAGKLSLIDLAGSERSLATDHCTIRTLEGANINRSLLSLSSCINALVEGKKHIPYRNSKLTQLLKDSLGGVCQTSMIANICPSNLSFGETQNTLHWADRAKEIRTKACMVTEEQPIPESESEKAKLLLELQEENKGLRMQLAKLQQRLLSAETNALLAGHNQQTPPALPLPKATVSRPSPSPTLSPYTKRRRGGLPLSSEALIEELQRKVKALETEKDKLQQDFKLREEKLAASLNQEHRVHLRRKDDLIRSLCQKGVAMEDGSKENAKPKGGGDLIKLSPLESICEKKKLEPTSKAPPKPSNLPPMAARRLSIVPPARANASSNKASMSARRLSVSASTKTALERPTRSSFARRLSTFIETPANTKATSMPARRLSIAPSSIITKPVLEKPTRAAFSRRLSTPIEAPTTSNKAASMAARRLSIAPLTATTTTTTTTTSTARKGASERPKISVTVKVSKVACPCPPPAKTPVQPSTLDGDKRKRREASRIPLHSSPRTPTSRTCSPLNDVAMTTQLRKRTFWDITNANSPTIAVGRCTRSNLMATPPSMLLQPGFLSSQRSRR